MPLVCIIPALHKLADYFEADKAKREQREREAAELTGKSPEEIDTILKEREKAQKINRAKEKKEADEELKDDRAKAYVNSNTRRDKIPPLPEPDDAFQAAINLLVDGCFPGPTRNAMIFHDDNDEIPRTQVDDEREDNAKKDDDGNKGKKKKKKSSIFDLPFVKPRRQRIMGR